MVWLYIGIMLLMRIVQSIFNKLNADAVPKNAIAYLKYTILYFGIAGVCAMALFGWEAITAPQDNLFLGQTILYAVISGIGLTVACCCSLYALTSGTMVLDSLFATAGLIVPTVASIFLYQEILSIWQWVFIGTFFIGAYLLVGNSKEVYGKFSVKTLLVLILSLLMTGVTMLTQTMFSREVGQGSVSLFSALSFCLSVVLISIVLSVVYLLYRVKGKTVNQGGKREFSLFPTAKNEVSIPKRNLWYAVALAFAIFLINQLATISANLISPVILFAFINGGATIISALVGMFIFKEKLNTKGIIGIIIGIGSLILIKIFAI